MTIPHTHSATNSDSCKGSCMNQIHIGIAHINSLAQFDRRSTVNMYLASQAHSRLGTCHKIRLEIRFDRQSYFKRQPEIHIVNRHGLMYLSTRIVFITDVGSTLQIHELR